MTTKAIPAFAPPLIPVSAGAAVELGEADEVVAEAALTVGAVDVCAMLVVAAELAAFEDLGPDEDEAAGVELAAADDCAGVDEACTCGAELGTTFKVENWTFWPDSEAGIETVWNTTD